MLSVPGNSENQVWVRDPAESAQGTTQGGARLFAALVQDVQQPQQHAQGDGGTGEKARQLCNELHKDKYLISRPGDM